MPRIASRPPLLVPIEELAGDRDVGAAVKRVLASYRKSLVPEFQRLIDGYHYTHAAHKVVGVGSVGTRSWIGLMLGRDAQDPLFLQFKEAQSSVLEAHTSKGRYAHHGRRVVEGQRLMQAAGDPLLGWMTAEGLDGLKRDFYTRQLWDGKGSAEVELMGPRDMVAYAQMCGWTLARAHARSGDRIAIAGYLGGGKTFSRAIGEFSQSYADQNEATTPCSPRPWTRGAQSPDRPLASDGGRGVDRLDRKRQGKQERTLYALLRRLTLIALAALFAWLRKVLSDEIVARTTESRGRLPHRLRPAPNPAPKADVGSNGGEPTKAELYGAPRSWASRAARGCPRPSCRRDQPSRLESRGDRAPGVTPGPRLATRLRPPPLAAESKVPPEQLRGPGWQDPVPASHQGDHRGHDQRPDHGRVEQDPGRQAGGQHLQVRSRPRGHRREGEEQDQRGARDQTACAADSLDHGLLGGAGAVVLLPHAAEDEHLVVHREAEQEREQHQRDPGRDRSGRLDAEQQLDP